MLTFYLHDGDTVVDFSCGANVFVPLVKQEGAKQGLHISGRSYDIITSQNLEDFERCSWLDVRPGLVLTSVTPVIGICERPALMIACVVFCMLCDACAISQSVRASRKHCKASFCAQGAQ